MRIAHYSLDPVAGDDPAHPAPPPPAYLIRPYVDSTEVWEAVADVHRRTFTHHGDLAPVDATSPREELLSSLSDTSQWLLAQHGGEVVGFAMGSNRFAEEEHGHVASLGVLPEHRGRGVAAALLRARFADDVLRGFLGTIVHVDLENPTGASLLFESVGMRNDEEYVSLGRPLLDAV